MKTTDVFAFMEECIIRKQEKDSTAELYRASCNYLFSLYNFLHKISKNKAKKR